LVFAMSQPSSQYLATPVGAQLLEHYARRDAVRHAAPLVPLRRVDVAQFLRALLGRRVSRNSAI
jgi:hypothetical protein